MRKGNDSIEGSKIDIPRPLAGGEEVKERGIVIIIALRENMFLFHRSEERTNSFFMPSLQDFN